VNSVGDRVDKVEVDRSRSGAWLWSSEPLCLICLGVGVCAQKYDYKVKMCCPKCEEKVREEAYEVPGENTDFGQTGLHITSYVCTYFLSCW
jgi:hypothetical protein